MVFFSVKYPFNFRSVESSKTSWHHLLEYIIIQLVSMENLILCVGMKQIYAEQKIGVILLVNDGQHIP